MRRAFGFGGAAAGVALATVALGTGAWRAQAQADARSHVATPDGAGLRLAYAPPPPPPRMPPATGEKLDVLDAAAEPAPVSSELAEVENANLMRRMEAAQDRVAAEQAAELQRQDAMLSRQLQALETPPADEPPEAPAPSAS